MLPTADFAAPLEVPLPLGSLDLVVRAATVGQIARMLKTAGPVVQTLTTLPRELLDALQDPDALTAGQIADLFELLSSHPDDLLQMVAIAADLRAEQVHGLMPDQFAMLFAVVVQVNADFFSRAAPVFNAAGRVLGQLVAPPPATPGPAPSTS